eukprot:gene13714-13831_t
MREAFAQMMGNIDSLAPIRLGSVVIETPPDLAAQKSILLRHYHAMLAHFGAEPGMRLARKHLAWYSRGLYGSADFRTTAMRTNTIPEVLDLIDRFYDPLIERGAARADTRAFVLAQAARPPAAHGPDPAALLSALPVPVVVLSQDNLFRFVNQAAEQFLGLSASQLGGMRLSDLLPEDHPIFALVVQVRTADVTISDHAMNFESPRLRKTGITVQGSPFPEEPGAVVLGDRLNAPQRIPPSPVPPSDVSAAASSAPASPRGLGDILLGRVFTMVLAMVALAMGVATFVVLSGGLRLDTRSDSLITGLVIANLVVLLPLGLVLVVRLVRVWVERRRGSAGSRLHVRLVVLFGVVAVTPAIVVAVFATFFFNLGIQAWFNDRVRTALHESLQASQGYLEEHRNHIRADAVGMSNDLLRAMEDLRSDPNAFGQVLYDQTVLRGLAEAVIYEPTTGQVIASTGAMGGFGADPPPPWALGLAQGGDVAVFGEETKRVRALVQMDSKPPLMLLISRPVDIQILEHMARTEDSVAEYDRLDEKRTGLQITFVLIFAVVALLVLSAAVLIGLLLANQIARPIGRLIFAAERVRAGDLATRVPESAADDEVGDLSRAFNRMTGQLSAQRGELMDAYGQIDQRRRFTEAVLSGVSAGVIGLDRQGAIELPNRAAASLLGLDLQASVGRPLVSLVPEFGPLIAAALASPHVAHTAELEIGAASARRMLLVRIGADRPEEPAHDGPGEALPEGGREQGGSGGDDMTAKLMSRTVGRANSSRLRSAVPDLARLPIAFDIRAISLIEGTRAALSTAAIVVASAYLHVPGLVEAALAALFTCLCDIGGPLRRRLPALLAFAGLGAVVVACGGLVRGVGPWAALPFGVVVIFCSSFARVYGPQAQQVGMFLSVTAVLSLDHAIGDAGVALTLAAMFAAGGAWATILTMLLWRVRPFQPVRRKLADVFAALALLSRDLHGLLGRGDIGGEAWELHARAHRSTVRAAIEAARTAILDTVRGRGPMSERASQSLLRIETADQLFGALIALSDLLETADAGERAAAAHMIRRLRPLFAVFGHEMLADRIEAHEQIARSIRAMLRDIEILPEGNRLRDMVGLIASRLQVLLTVSATAERSADAGEGVQAPRFWQALSTPVRANLSWQSTSFRHALRATVTAAPALAYGLWHNGPFDHWLSITILVTMQPFFGNTFMRAAERVAGTTLGGLMAAGLGLVITTPFANAMAMFPLALVAFTLRSVSFGLFVSALTPMIVLLVELGQPGAADWVIAGTRVALTMAGGVIAVVACYVLWPSWEPNRLGGEIKAAILAHAAYADAEIGLLLRENPAGLVEQRRRAAGLTSNNVEASVARALLEPRGSQSDRLEAAMVIDAALRRMAGRLTAMQHDPGQPGAMPVEAWQDWRRWLSVSLGGLAAGGTALEPHPALEEGPHTVALGRIARQVELIAGTIERIRG